jgi:hypothetical protein
MRRASVLFALAASLVPPPAFAGDTPPPSPGTSAELAQLQRAALTGTRAFDFVRSLTDEVGPRLAGSPGDAAAVAWAVKTMKDLGLQSVRAEPVKVTHWDRGQASAELLGPTPRQLVVTALGGSVATPPRGLEGDVIEAASLEELKKLDPTKVHDKIVFLDPPMRRARDGAGYGEVVGARARGAAAAQALGATAMLLRSAGTDHDRVAHTGAKSKDEHEIPAAALSVPDAELLHRTLAEHGAARVRLTLTPRLLPDAESANVVGEVRGRELPDQIVLVGAHLDSWDPGSGALDDGAGVAVALETARLFAAQPRRPRRTLRVVLFANEEHGIQGAKEYARQHAAEADAHVVATEADLGSDAVFAVSWKGDPTTRERFLSLARALAPLGIERLDDGKGAGADVTPLLALGVPILELHQDATRYFDYHHTPNDTLDKIDPPTLQAVAAAFATAAWVAADMDGDFGRVPDAERKNPW